MGKHVRVCVLAGALCLAFASACGPSQGGGGFIPGKGGKTSTDDAITTCLEGLWFLDTTLNQDCICFGSMPTPECDQPDCSERNFRWFAGEFTTTGRLHVSRELGTFSSFSLSEETDQYEVDARQLTLGDDDPVEVVCTDSYLEVSGRPYNRAPDDLSKAMTRAWEQRGDDGQWRGVSIEP